MKEVIVVQENANKRDSKIVIIMAIILVIAVIGVTGYILKETGVLFKSDNKTEEKETGNEVENKNTTEEKKEEESIPNNNTAVQPLDVTKCLNRNGYTFANPTDVQGNYGISMNINSDKKSITLNIDWNVFGPISGLDAYAPSVLTYQITGFTKEIKEVFIGDVGQDAMGITLFYLMTDGTVEYTPMFVSKTDTQNNSYYEINYTYDTSADGKLSSQRFETKGMIPGVEQVEKFYISDASYGVSGWKTTLGAKEDGSFYDLSIING